MYHVNPQMSAKETEMVKQRDKQTIDFCFMIENRIIFSEKKKKQNEQKT